MPAPHRSIPRTSASAGGEPNRPRDARALGLRLALGALALALLAGGARAARDAKGGAAGGGGAGASAGADARAESSEDREHQIKAAFLLNFIRYATWPEASLGDADRPIRVLVVGKDPFGSVLESTFRGEKAHGRAIEIARSSEVPAEPSAHLVFCGELSRAEREALLARCKARPVLLVGELEGLALAGAIVNFYIEDKKTRFEINTDALARSGIELSPAVLKLARIVRARKEDG